MAAGAFAGEGGGGLTRVTRTESASTQLFSRGWKTTHELPPRVERGSYAVEDILIHPRFMPSSSRLPSHQRPPPHHIIRLGRDSRA